MSSFSTSLPLTPQLVDDSTSAMEKQASLCPSASMTIPCCSRSSSSTSLDSNAVTPDLAIPDTAEPDEDQFASQLKTALWTMAPPPHEDDKPNLPGPIENLPSRERQQYLSEYFKYTRAMAMREHDCNSRCSSSDCSLASSPSFSRTSSTTSQSNRKEELSRAQYHTEDDTLLASQSPSREAYDADVESDMDLDSEDSDDSSALPDGLYSLHHTPELKDEEDYYFDILGAPLLRSESLPSDTPPLNHSSDLLDSPAMELSSASEDKEDSASPNELTIPVIKINGVDFDIDEYLNQEQEAEADSSSWEVASEAEEDPRYLRVPPISYGFTQPTTVLPAAGVDKRQLPTVPGDRTTMEEALTKALSDNTIRHVVAELLQGRIPITALLDAGRSLNDLD